MTTSQTSDAGTFETVNPATGQVIGLFPVAGPEQAAAAVSRAREASRWWAELGWRERRNRLLDWKAQVTRQLDELAILVHDETGKPADDARLEIVLAILHIDWAARHAHRVLGAHRVFSGVAALNLSATVEYQPLGVIGVIGPWNYPVLTPMGSIAYALAAGNAVIFKPSEFTPAVGEWLVASFAQTAGRGSPQPVLQLLTGDGRTGAALTTSGVDKVAFTGSAATARKVMAAAAERLTPVIAECGGKDALIVDADADLNAAADAAAWGGLSNAGQTCIGVERVYVADPVYETFLAKLTERVTALRPGSEAGASYGPMTMPSQIEVIRRHLTDAVARGGRALPSSLESVEDAIDGGYVRPVILTDVPEDAAAVREETFGPTITVRRVASLEEGIRLANASAYGLGASIFSGSRRRAVAAARALRTGAASVNSVVSFMLVPALPFGGVGESGFGRIHGADGLREFARAKSIASQWMKSPAPVTTFARTDKDVARTLGLVRFLHGRRRPRS
ncbi:MAG: aldehyde dehydrogenase family protein [Actinobacteria bacterium]|nr:aldehyde dehydrogenase family protein [Actinomycetota bacterium]